MTLPDERYRAIVAAEEFLRDLMDPKKTPRLPKTVRKRARSILKHYPGSWDLKQIEDLAPNVIQERMEPLYRIVKEHELRLSKEIDQTYKICNTCKNGVYKEIDISDIWQSLLHCSNCGEAVPRFQYRENQ